MGATPEIELRGVTCLRGGYEALKGASLSIAEGETLFAMGGAGSGKSVLIKTAAGISLPNEGEVLYRGRSLARMSPREEAAFRKASGFVFQDAALWANQSLYDNLALPARLHEKAWGAAEVDRAVRRAAELVGYGQELRARPADLSAGERKLVGLARALVLDPELLFMDEPVSSLDEAAAERVSDIIEALKERGRTVLIASASSDLASRRADRIAVLIGGSIAAAGPYDEAVAWTDAGVRAVTGRLKARAAASPAWAGGLAGAWAEALAEDTAVLSSEGAAAGDAKPPAGDGAGFPALGDIINDVEGPDEGPDGEKRGGS
jgi:phospholipid/cholesterol/gamma-HCH transport system ATP-binding protein